VGCEISKKKHVIAQTKDEINFEPFSSLTQKWGGGSIQKNREEVRIQLAEVNQSGGTSMVPMVRNFYIIEIKSTSAYQTTEVVS